MIDSEFWLTVWDRFKSGDREAFRTIYNEFIDALYSYGSRFTSDRDLLKDAIQDLFIDIYTYGSSLRKPESLEFYLFKTLKRIIIRKLIEKNRNFSIQELKDSFVLNFSVEETASNEDIEITFRKLQEEISQLVSHDRELLFLKFNTGLTYIEIGQLLDIKSNTVKKRIYRILDKLRSNLGDDVMVLFLMCCRT